MIRKLWEGIKSMGTWLKEQLGGFISNAISAITGGSSKTSASSGGGAGRRSAAPAAENSLEAPVLFRAARQSGAEELTRNLSASLADSEAAARTVSSIRRVQRDLGNVSGSVVAYYNSPEVRSAGNRQSGNQSSGITAEELGTAVREALNGAKVVLDGRTAGKLITAQENNRGRALGTL